MSDSVVISDHLGKTFRRTAGARGLAGALKHLVRPAYETITAVDDISFRIEAGEAVGYLGPNGAGKSTTIKLLTGILVPTSGTATVCGLEPHRDRKANGHNISVVFGQRTQLWWDIPIADSLRLLGDIYQVPGEQFRRTMDELVDVLDLAELLGSPARQLSLGQRMRCDLAAALVHEPRVLFLDEPTIGLDVAVKARLREFISTMRRTRELTVLLTSHDLGDIEQLCPRLLMIDKARLIYDGTFAEVTRRFGARRTIRVTLPDADPEAITTVNAALARATPEVTGDATSLEIDFDSAAISPGEVIRTVASTLPISDIAVAEVDAEAIIRQLYEGTLHLDDGANGAP